MEERDDCEEIFVKTAAMTPGLWVWDVLAPVQRLDERSRLVLSIDNIR
jgi:hypothetical protein